MALSDIIKPIITEKTMSLGQNGQFTFLVKPNAKKHAIAKAIEKLFKVNVTRVNLLKNHGKTRSSGKKRLNFTTASRKKAIITLEKGQSIEYFNLSDKETKAKVKASAKKETIIKKPSKLKSLFSKKRLQRTQGK